MFAKQPSTPGGGGLFGAASSGGTPLFGTMQQQQAAQSPGGFFSLAQPTTGGLFGAAPTATTTQQQQPSLFGGTTGLFGAQRPTGTPSLFGAPTTATPGAGGGLFGTTPAPAPTTSLFGAPTSTGLFAPLTPPAPALTAGGPIGTKDIQWREEYNKETNGRIQTITYLPEVNQTKCAEELRWEDYCAGLTPGKTLTVTPTGLFGAALQPAGGLFGAAAPTTGLFGTTQPAQRPTGLFGTTQPITGGLFGTAQPTTTTTTGGLFGTAPLLTTTGGLFGTVQPVAAKASWLGAPTTTTGGLFGTTTTTGLFGAPQPATAGGLFGTQQPTAPTTTGGLFGTQPTTPTTTGLFGVAKAAPPTTGLFAPAPTAGGLFGTQAPPSPGLFRRPTTAPTPFIAPLFAPRPAAPAPSTGLFGTQPTTTTTAGGLFGTQPTTTAGGLFGVPQQPAAGGLFAQQPTTTTGGLFGTQPTATTAGGLFATQPTTAASGLFETQPTTTPGGLFGTQPTATAGGFFGTQPTPTAGGGLFGAQPTTTAGGLFGPQQPPAGGGLFGTQLGGLGQQQGGLFGTQPPAFGGLFGPQQQQQTAVPTTVGGIPQVQQPTPPSAPYDPYGLSKLYGAVPGYLVPAVAPAPFAFPASGVILPTQYRRYKSASLAQMWKPLPEYTSELRRQPLPSLTPKRVVRKPQASSIGLAADYGWAEPPPFAYVFPLGVEPPPPRLTSRGEWTPFRSVSEEEALMQPLTPRTPEWETPRGGPKPPAWVSQSLLRRQRRASETITMPRPPAETVPSVPARGEETPIRLTGRMALGRKREEEEERRRRLVLTCTREGYSTRPTIETLSAYSEARLAAVEDFTVYREGYGEITWPGLTDVRGLNVDDAVLIEDKAVEVYPDEYLKAAGFEGPPPVGVGLNKPAIVTLFGCGPKEGLDEKAEGFQAVYDTHVRRMRRYTEDKLSAHFIAVSPQGVWRFRVDHF